MKLAASKKLNFAAEKTLMRQFSTTTSLMTPQDPQPAFSGSDPASAPYTPLLARAKIPRFSLLLDPDPRIPKPPFDLIPGALKLDSVDYPGTSTEFYAHYKFQDQLPSAAYLNEQYLHKPRNLLGGFYAFALPEVRKKYQFLAASPAAARDLGINLQHELNTANSTHFEELVSGQKLSSVFPYSQAYAGFQFGQFAGQLGDGRVVTLFEIQDPKGNYIEVQLKGSGKTAFSRFADGKAVLRSSVREFVISEYLRAVGVPAAGCLALTNLPATYAQRSGPSSCAVVARFAPSWVRVGTFDLYRARGDRDGMRRLADYCVDVLNLGVSPEFGDIGSSSAAFSEEHAAHSDSPADSGAGGAFSGDSGASNAASSGNAASAASPSSSSAASAKYERLYYDIVTRNAKSTALCQVYGFLNGVLNTDNTSILGLCIDFGPFAVMDKFDPNYTPNSEDPEKRYGYDNVPSSIWWNLTRLGEDLAELIGFEGKPIPEDITPEIEKVAVEKVNAVISAAHKQYQQVFLHTYVAKFMQRLGLKFSAVDANNDAIVAPMLQMLLETEIPYNGFFSTLESLDVAAEATQLSRAFIPQGFAHSKWDNDTVQRRIEEFLVSYRSHVEKQQLSFTDRRAISKGTNPLFVPSNWVLEEVVDGLRDSRCTELAPLRKLVTMACFPFEKEKWGDDLKSLESRWLGDEEYDGEKYMSQCSCAS